MEKKSLSQNLIYFVSSDEEKIKEIKNLLAEFWANLSVVNPQELL